MQTQLSIEQQPIKKNRHLKDIGLVIYPIIESKIKVTFLLT